MPRDYLQTAVLLLPGPDGREAPGIIDALRDARPSAVYFAREAGSPPLGSLGERCAVRELELRSGIGVEARETEALSWFFNEVEEGIILDGDEAPEDGFFPYCQGVLRRYRDDRRIMMVSGKAPGRDLAEATESLYFSRIFRGGAWATWRRSWRLYDRFMLKFIACRDNGFFEALYADRYAVIRAKERFQAAYERRKDCFWERWEYSCLVENGLCAVPREFVDPARSVFPLNVCHSAAMDEAALRAERPPLPALIGALLRDAANRALSSAKDAARPIVRSARRPQIPKGSLHAFRDSHPMARESARGPAETLAIILPCYNHARFLRKTLQSVTSQTRLPDEFIVVNDRATDGTTDILREFLESRPGLGSTKVTVIEHEENVGQAASINEAAGLAKSDLVMILNDDDYLFHDLVEITLALFQKYPTLHLLGGHCVQFTDDAFVDRSPKLIGDLAELDQINLSVRSPEAAMAYRGCNDLNMTHSGSTFLRSSFSACGGYLPKGERIVEFTDRDFQLRMNALFLVGVSNEIPLLYWRYGSSTDAGTFS